MASPDPGVARGRFDDGAAPSQQPLGLGGLDHGQGGPVFGAAAGVEELELGEQLAGQVPADAVHANQRRVADEVDERVGGLDGRAGVGDRRDLDAWPGVERHVAVDGHRQAGPVQLAGHVGGPGRAGSSVAPITPTERGMWARRSAMVARGKRSGRRRQPAGGPGWPAARERGRHPRRPGRPCAHHGRLSAGALPGPGARAGAGLAGEAHFVEGTGPSWRAPPSRECGRSGGGWPPQLVDREKWVCGLDSNSPSR